MQYNLTKREKEIAKLYLGGCFAAKIAETLCISINTVNSHFANIRSKMHAQSMASAAIEAIKRNEININEVNLA